LSELKLGWIDFAKAAHVLGLKNFWWMLRVLGFKMSLTTCLPCHGKYNKRLPWSISTFQMYRHDSLGEGLRKQTSGEGQGICLWGKASSWSLHGEERDRAEEMSYPSPIN